MSHPVGSASETLNPLYIPIIGTIENLESSITQSARKAQETWRQVSKTIGDELKQGFAEGARQAEQEVNQSGSRMQANMGAIAGRVAAVWTEGFHLAEEGFHEIIHLGEEAVQQFMEIGETWEQVNRTLRATTTATGEQLEGLKGTVADIAKDTSAGFDSISQAVGVLHQRTGMSGDALKSLAQDVVNAKAVFGQPIDVTAFTGAINSLGGDMGQADSILNQMANTARATGVPLNELIGAVKNGGPTMRQFGNEIGPVTTLMAKMQEGGINPSRAVFALNRAMTTAAKQGKDFQSFLDDSIDRIKKFYDAGDDGKAQDLAIKIFGARGGANIATAIQENILSSQSLKDSFVDLGDAGAQSITQIYDQTKTLSDRITEFKHDISDALAPFAEPAMEELGKEFQHLADWVDTHGDVVTRWLINVADVVEEVASDSVRSIGQMIQAYGSLEEVFGGDGSAAQKMGKQWQDVADNMDAARGKFDAWGSKLADSIKLSEELAEVIGKTADGKGLVLKTNTPEVAKALDDLKQKGVDITEGPDHQLKFSANTEAAADAINRFVEDQTGKKADVAVNPEPKGPDGGPYTGDPKTLFPGLDKGIPAPIIPTAPGTTPTPAFPGGQPVPPSQIPTFTPPAPRPGTPFPWIPGSSTGGNTPIPLPSFVPGQPGSAPFHDPAEDIPGIERNSDGSLKRDKDGKPIVNLDSPFAQGQSGNTGVNSWMPEWLRKMLGFDTSAPPQKAIGDTTSNGGRGSGIRFNGAFPGLIPGGQGLGDYGAINDYLDQSEGNDKGGIAQLPAALDAVAGRADKTTEATDKLTTQVGDIKVTPSLRDVGKWFTDQRENIDDVSAALKDLVGGISDLGNAGGGLSDMFGGGASGLFNGASPGGGLFGGSALGGPGGGGGGPGVPGGGGGPGGGPGLVGPGASGGGAEAWRSVVRNVLETVGPQYGITNIEAWEDALVRQIGTESGGNAGVGKNLHDSNAAAGHPSSGLLQFIPSTYAANNILGRPDDDPIGQIAAAIPYVVGKYGMTPDGAPNFIGQGHGFATGGLVRRLAGGGDSDPDHDRGQEWYDEHARQLLIQMDPDRMSGFAYGGAVGTEGAGGNADPDLMPLGGWGPGGKLAYQDMLKGVLPNPGWNDDHHADGHNLGGLIRGFNEGGGYEISDHMEQKLAEREKQIELQKLAWAGREAIYNKAGYAGGGLIRRFAGGGGVDDDPDHDRGQEWYDEGARQLLGQLDPDRMSGFAGGGFATKWNPGVIDPGNPIQPKDFSSLNEYLMAINLANFMGHVNSLYENQGHEKGGLIRRFQGGGYTGDDEDPDQWQLGHHHVLKGEGFDPLPVINPQPPGMGGFAMEAEEGAAADLIGDLWVHGPEAVLHEPHEAPDYGASAPGHGVLNSMAWWKRFQAGPQSSAGSSPLLALMGHKLGGLIQRFDKGGGVGYAPGPIDEKGWAGLPPTLRRQMIQNWATQAAVAEGVDPKKAVPALMDVISRESGVPGVRGTGDPNIINLWDSNAKKGDPSIGLAQVTQGTLNDPENANIPGGNAADPVTNLRGALRHVASRGLNIWDTPEARGRQIGYNLGGLSEIQTHAYGGNVWGGNGDIDDIPAYLTDGEFVIRKDMARMWRPLLEYINGAEGATGHGIMQMIGGMGIGGFEKGGIAENWDPPVIDPTNPIQPKDFSSVNEYLMAINLANFMGSLNALHESHGHAKGGPIRRFDTGGLAGDSSSTASPQHGGIPGLDSGAGEDVVGWIRQVVGEFNASHGTNLQITGDFPGGPAGHGDDGGQHSFGHAADVSGDPEAMNAFAQWWVQQPELLAVTRQLIHDSPGFADSSNVIGGHFTTGSQTYAQDYASEGSMVHLAVQSIPGQNGPGGVMPTQQMGGGTGAEQYYPSPYPGYFYDKAGKLVSGSSMTGYGNYGGATQSEITGADSGVNSAQKHLDDIGTAIGKLNDKIKDLTDGLDISADPDADKDKIKTLQDELAAKTAEETEATSNLTNAKAKQSEIYNKPPPDVLNPKAKGQAPGASAAQAFGGSLISGALEGLGFDDKVFSDPMNWGIWKLFTGGANFAGGLLQNIGKSKTGMFAPPGSPESDPFNVLKGPFDGTGNPLVGLESMANMIPGVNIPTSKNSQVASAVTPIASAFNGGQLPPPMLGAPGYGPAPGPGNPIDGSTHVNYYGPVTQTNPNAPIQGADNAATRVPLPGPAAGPVLPGG